jgi:hypoxanthine phosphoribosyltransferase
MPELIPVLDKDSIAQKVADVAKQISSDYQDRDLVLVGVLKGAFVFMADLVRQITLEEFTVEFVRVASYGSGSESSGDIRMIMDLDNDITGKDVLIVEDIIDTGRTAEYLSKILKRRGPRTLKLCTFIEKMERREKKIESDYVGHQIDRGFIVGYGLDYNETYRNLPGIFHIKM